VQEWFVFKRKTRRRSATPYKVIDVTDPVSKAAGVDGLVD